MALFLGELPLLVHVGPSDELDTKVEVGFLAGAYLHRDHVGHPLQVALVAVHDNDSLTFVELVGHLLAERLNRSLYETLLRIHIQVAVLLKGVSAELLDSSRKAVEVLEVLVGHASKYAPNFSGKGSAPAINIEQVAIRIAGNIAHLI